MIVTRFAPSPTGHLHLGHAFAAITAHDMAKRAGGRVLLRIENIDQSRCKPEYEGVIFEDLAWLGLKWEQPVLHQSERFTAYRAALDRLELDGLPTPASAPAASPPRLRPPPRRGEGSSTGRPARLRRTWQLTERRARDDRH